MPRERMASANTPGPASGWWTIARARIGAVCQATGTDRNSRPVLLHGRHGAHWRTTAPSEARPGSLGLVLVATGTAMFLVDLDFFALNLSIPRMAQDLSVSATDMQWVISGYMLALGVPDPGRATRRHPGAQANADRRP